MAETAAHDRAWLALSCLRKKTNMVHGIAGRCYEMLAARIFVVRATHVSYSSFFVVLISTVAHFPHYKPQAICSERHSM